jgi:hypothetical protein
VEDRGQGAWLCLGSYGFHPAASVHASYFEPASCDYLLPCPLEPWHGNGSAITQSLGVSILITSLGPKASPHILSSEILKHALRLLPAIHPPTLPMLDCAGPRTSTFHLLLTP